MPQTNLPDPLRKLLERATIALLLCALSLTPLSFPVAGYAAPQKKQQSATKNRRSKNNPKPTSGKNTSATKGKNIASKGKQGQKETSADVRKRQESTRKEIKLTEEQIRENERRVKSELNELGKIQSDIADSKKRISVTTSRIAVLDSKISSLRDSISTNEKELAHLRAEYLKAVKKMRLTRRGSSALSFIFSSDNFHQALRRMRYMKEFSAWKDRQASAIREKNAALTRQRDNLAVTRTEHDRELALQRKEQSNLEAQYTRHDAIVAGLKSDGAALKSHLSRKQAEAAALRERISLLIAEEERKAAEERARQKAERKAAEERARQEAERKVAEERERLEAQRKDDAEKARLEAATAEAEADSRKKESEEKKLAGKKRKEEEKRRKEELKRKKEEEKRRKAENKKKTDSAPAVEEVPKPVAPKPAVTEPSGMDFSVMKGSLPPPVSGAFKVTSRFGRQNLPDLPDVVFDNPGIDAEASAGASALAVFPGKVSGVYILPGYNTVVIINHGNYYTVYGNIARASVKVGDSVRAGHSLGALAADEDNHGLTSIHFEVWRNREKLNPLDWIR